MLSMLLTDMYQNDLTIILYDFFAKNRSYLFYQILTKG